MDETTDPAGTPTGPSPEPSPEPSTPASPGERRLAHPPSDRYRAAEAALEAAAEPPDPAASTARGVTVATVLGIVGAALTVLLGGVLADTTGLVVVAGVTALAVSLALRVGARENLTSSRRMRLAIGLALAAVALGQLGLWLYARNEGGVLGPFDYLWQVFGLLVPLQFATAAVVAWVTAR